MDSSLTLAYVLIVAGFLLLVAELFLPTSGTLFMLSVGSIAVGVALAFLHDPSIGWITLVTVFIAFPLFVGVLWHLWPKTPLGKRMILTVPEEEPAAALSPALAELESLKGRFGRTLSPLRPSGVTEFDGKRVDTITEGVMVEPGQWVRCIEVRAGKVVVRPVEKPDLGNLETAIFS